MKAFHGNYRRSNRGPAGGLEHPGGFTLIELMVVVAIIALLVSVMLPAFSNVRTKAKVVQTESLFAALTQANEQFQVQGEIGGGYVPSQTDSLACSGTVSAIMDPLGKWPSPQEFDPVMGASLLVYGLAGADALGSAGFRDLNNDGYWWNDQHNVSQATGADADGSYALDDSSGGSTFEPLQPRYGPFVSDKALERVFTFKQLIEDGVILANSFPCSGTDDPCRAQKVFVDPWDQPILYYRARRGATWMTTSPGAAGSAHVGVYDHRDNSYLTGSNQPPAPDGLDLGGGIEHGIRMVNADVSLDPKDDDLSTTAFDDTFEQFIWDRSVAQRNTVVNRDTFLLISAGPDGLYGTNDDVVNWTRRQ